MFFSAFALWAGAPEAIAAARITVMITGREFLLT
jgi:hypothetical protein